MQNISKKLLSTVLKKEIPSFTIEKEYILTPFENINIYEFSHMCKQYLKERKLYLLCEDLGSLYKVSLSDTHLSFFQSYEFIQDTEIEATFEATCWAVEGNFKRSIDSDTLNGVEPFELDYTYTNIDEANTQVQLNINEKNKIIEKLIEEKENRENFTELSRWLMAYIMELHDFRNKLTKKEFLDDIPENMKEIIIMNFPMLQGSRIQRLFREIGLTDYDQEKVNKAFSFLQKEYL